MRCPVCDTAIDSGSPRFCPNCGRRLQDAPSQPASDASSQPAPDPLIGQVLGGKFRVLRLLGEGGMGAVYEGEQPLGAAKRKVAVKTLHAHLSRDPKIQARFEREAATISELEHPNTIQVYDFGSTPDGILYFVMEFLHGHSVADRLAVEGAMAPRRAAHVVDQICGSLEEAHGRGIIHRDLKPDNVVLVDRAGQKDFVKVLDFGIAKRMSAPEGDEQKLTQQGMVVGTPPYMSPEQFAGRAVDARSDIYSLGVMAYEMLTGKLPFKANTAWEWAAQHLTSPPIPIESLAEGKRVPPSMRRAIERALAKSPDDRFQTVRSFSDAFAGTVAVSTPETLDDRMSAPRTELAAPVGVGAGPEERRDEKRSAERPPSAAGPLPHTPTAGSMAFPTPVPLAEAPAVPSRRRRGLLLAIAAVIGAGSALAIAFALKGEGRAPRGAIESSEPALPAAPATSIAPADLGPAEAIGAPADASSDIPPLAAAGDKSAHSAPSAPRSALASPPSSSVGGFNAHPSSGAQIPPAAVATAAPSLEWLPPKEGSFAATAGSAPSVSSTGAAPSNARGVEGEGARYDGPECQKARILRAFGRNREARSWVLACLAKGGSL